MSLTQIITRPDGSTRTLSKAIRAVATASARLALSSGQIPRSRLVYQVDTDVLYRCIDDALPGSEAAWFKEGGPEGAASSTGAPGWAPSIVGLTGGGATKLDGVNGVLDGSTVFTVDRLFFIRDAAAGVLPVTLKAGTQATNGVGYVRPANYQDGVFEYVFNIG